MDKPYKVYGDYGYVDETLLEEFETKSEATKWALDYTGCGADLGGYSVIEVASFAEDGEYIVHGAYTEDSE